MTASSAFRGFSGGSLGISINTSQSTSGNMVNFRDGCYITITVNYTESASTSTGSLSPTSVQVGNSIYLYISAASGTFHTATWVLGSFSSNQSIASGQSNTYFTIPESWSSAITGTSATGRVTLYTYTSSGSLVGSNTYYFTVTLPASASAPTIGSFSLVHIPGNVPADWGVLVQGKSKVQMVLQNVAASPGGTISAYKFSGGGYSWNSSSDLSYTTGVLSTSGTNAFTATVTDSRGYSTTKTLSVHVEPYEPPAIVSLTTYRCDATSPYAANETGASI